MKDGHLRLKSGSTLCSRKIFKYLTLSNDGFNRDEDHWSSKRSLVDSCMPSMVSTYPRPSAQVAPHPAGIRRDIHQLSFDLASGKWLAVSSV